MSTTLTIGEFKARLPEALALVQKGESVTVTYGRNKRPVAVFGPPAAAPLSPRVPGRFAGQFRVPDEAFFAPLSSSELADWETSELVPPRTATKPPA
jgi:antitoxin (DNA-binding transcriptional repressor) of toxin-antitoxin stability system